MANQKKNVKSDNKIPVELAGRDFVLKRVPMARVKKLGSVIQKLISDFGELDLNNTDNAAEVVLDHALEFPYELLSLFINDLPKEIFDDEENGVTFPEFIDTLQKAIELNRLDTLKNFLSPLISNLAEFLPNQGSE